MKQKQIIITVPNKAKIPIVELSVDSVNCFAFVDTGAETTVFDSEFIQANRIEALDTGNKISFVGLNGEIGSIPVYKVEATVVFPNSSDNTKETEIRGITSDLSAVTNHFKDTGDNITISCIIGSDTLSKLEAEIDYDKEVIRINNDISRKQKNRHNKS